MVVSASRLDGQQFGTDGRSERCVPERNAAVAPQMSSFDREACDSTVTLSAPTNQGTRDTISVECYPKSVVRVGEAKTQGRNRV